MKVRSGHLTLLVLFVSLMMIFSCAKRQVKVEEKVKAPEAVPPKVVEKKEVAPAPSAPKVPYGETEAYKKAEAERQARLRELEKRQRLIDEMQQFMNEKIYFDFDKYELKPEAKRILRKKAEWLKRHPEFFLRIEGHCDERGTNEYNMALGEKRAQAAKKYLISLGIYEKRIRTISFGEERPVDPRHNEEAWAKNRRDEFRLLK